jgi:hypothetical protein
VSGPARRALGLRFARGTITGSVLGFVAACGGGGGGGSWSGGGSHLTPNSVDFTVDEEELQRSIAFSTEFFDVTDCAYVEGLVEAPGLRRLLRFSTFIVNLGELDAVIGSPANPVPPLVPSDFEYSPCHGHSHFLGWGDYTLEDAAGRAVAFGHKQAFCLRDSLKYFGVDPGGGYDCDFQGISSGWGDAYTAGLDGQWIDITGLAAGNYTIVVTVNAERKIVEAHDVYANTVRVPVVIPAAP